MRWFSAKKPAENEEEKCEHFIRIGDECWYCTNEPHDLSEQHYNDVIHAVWR
jgi:hypothetical protein